MRKVMDHEELAERIESRLDKIEAKLDRHIQLTTENEVDLRWVKGTIKWIVTVSIALMGSMGAIIFEYIIKK